MTTQLVFRFSDGPLFTPRPVPVVVEPPRPRPVVYLVGCGKKKLRRAARGKELYTGNLFQAARAHAEREATTWRIVSARYGLLNPENRVKPYELTIRQYSEFERIQWAQAVVGSLCYEMIRQGFGARDFDVVILAGADYAGPLAAKLEDSRISYTTPLEGLQVGQRLAWFKAQRNEVMQ